MKKRISLLLIFTMLFSLIQMPLLNSAFAAQSFPGQITGSTASPGKDGKGTVTVTGVNAGVSLKLYKADKTPVSGPTTDTTFRDLIPGKYYVTAMLDENGTSVESNPSNTVEVKPAAVTITIQDGNVQVTGAIPGALITLYNNRSGYVPNTTNADTSGIGTFSLKDVPPGLNYQAKQTIDGVESALSDSKINILPEQVKATASANAGPSNNQGTVNILEATADVTVRLYDANDKIIDSKTTDANGNYSFTGLKAGKYFVTQIVNNAESPKVQVDISDAQAPVITLIGDAEVRLVYGQTYTDKGATVTDNIDTGLTATTGGDTINNETPPGIYTITYNAEDSQGNKAIEVTRKVIIIPKTVTLSPVGTDEAALSSNTPPRDRRNGKINVTDVYSGSILYLYQDPGGVLIRTITDANAATYEIKEVPVGKDYYVIQEFTNANGSVVQSEPSKRTEVKDTTDPELELNGAGTINLVMGDQYIEYGAKAIDNIDTEAELATRIQITIKDSSGATIEKVDTNKPGKYTVTYNVTDKAGNRAKSEERTVIVSPRAVLAIGSTADLAEVGVKNALPGAKLQLYDVEDETTSIMTHTLRAGETTHVFKEVPPGRYYVTQTAGGFESDKSNVVEIVDIDRPYITLEGPEKLSFVLNTAQDPDFNNNVFTDPGATAKDYLEGNLTNDITTKLTTPNGTTTNCSTNTKCDVTVTEPGIYTITYSVTAPKRSSKADDKQRIITVAPPKTAKPTSDDGTNEIKVTDVYNHATTVVTLYNTYKQKLETKVAKSTVTATFTKIPAGLGYYVTQTVNGIESAPSEPVNVNIHKDATDAALMTAFEFPTLGAYGVIDNESNKISVVVSKGTDVSNLKATFSAIGKVTVNGVQQTSGTSAQNFTNPVVYLVTSKDGKVSKQYTVTVTEAMQSSYARKETLNKNVALTSSGNSIVLTAGEQAVAALHGVSFATSDMMIHVPATNVKKSTNPALSAKKLTRNDVTTASDPAWRNNLANIIDINWGNETKSFLQPLEIELPDNKSYSFVRLVREQGRLYAYTQPTEQKNNRIIGLATEPGTYAFMENVARPTILSNQLNGETVYRLYSFTTGATIYYTTTSSELGFDRSAWDRSLKSYLFTGTVSDLTNNWTKYEPGTFISAPKGELYAVAVHNQIISPISAIEPPEAKQWKESPIQTVERHKVWKIQFSARVDEKSLYSNSIYVTDDTTGREVKTTLHVSSDGKTISIVPVEAYETNKQYTLWIDRQMKGNTKAKEFLIEPTKITFIVK